jgi:hypothetical protein
MPAGKFFKQVIAAAVSVNVTTVSINLYLLLTTT